MKRIGKITLFTLVSILIVWACFILWTAPQKAEAAERGTSFHYVYSLTGSSPYARFVNLDLGTVWDDAASALAASPTWTDTDVALTDNTSTVGGWLVNVPSAIPNGLYDILIYDVSATASSSDTVSGKSRRAYILSQSIQDVANP